MKTFKQYLNESVHDHLDHFVGFASNHLGLDNPPSIELVDDKEHAQENASFGGYSPSDHSIKVNIAGRHTADVFRTLAHELVHHKQNLDNRIQHDSGATGSDIENEANSQAGVIMRNYAKANRAIFEARRKPQNPADYPHVQNALLGKKRKVMFSADKPEKKVRKGRVRWHIEKM
jgi:hypothetical protein